MGKEEYKVEELNINNRLDHNSMPRLGFEPGFVAVRLVCCLLGWHM